MNFMDKWAAPIAGAIMIIVVMVVISGFTPTRSLFCREDEICLREWLTATSGWAAALAAFVTLFALRRQVAAQEKQIDHQLGNVEPDMMVRCTVGEDFSPVAQITVTNRNRRPLSVNYLEAVPINRVKLFPHNVKIGESDRPQEAFGLPGTIVNCLMPGKEDGRLPSTAVITCFFEPEGEPDSDDADGFARYHVKIVCHGRLHGDTTTPRVITADAELVMMS